MNDQEIPPHFICPISLQIMQDPVTVATGITYDRASIQRWQTHAQSNTCPVTKQPLPIPAHFTPNHNLRRLIQSWQVSSVHDQLLVKESASKMKVMAIDLVKNLNLPDLELEVLKSLRKLALEGGEMRVCLREVGVVRAMIEVVVLCYMNCTIVGLKEALDVLNLVRVSQDEARWICLKHDGIIGCLVWVLSLDNACDDEGNTNMKLHAIVLLKDIIPHANSHVLERLNREFFNTIVGEINNLEHGIKDLLRVMVATCAWPRNCSMMIESGAVFELIELELESPEKGITELIMAVLVHLCSIADGRAQLLGHAAGLAVITKRIAKVSRKVDERALMIISLVSKFAASDGVLKEMVRVGTVEKLCMVLQVDGIHSYTREKAKEILKRHSNVWKDSPCLDVTLLTRYPR